jgi:tetratricopeptide (TPR) repeat protein
MSRFAASETGDAAAMTTFERDAVLRNAQKLLRIGKLELAIAQYEKVLRESKDDVSTAALLGGLYVRAGTPERAVEHFTEIADGLRSRGAVMQAAAAYRRVLAIEHDNEHALLNLAELAAGQRNISEARGFLTTVQERRRDRGDLQGAAKIVIQLAALDPTDFTARLAGACARQELGDISGAVADLRNAADDLLDTGRHSDAASMLKEATLLAPVDRSLTDRLFEAYLLAGNFDDAREAARTPGQWKRLANTLLAVDDEHALDVLREAAGRQPDDIPLQASLARWFVAHGDAAGAASHLRVEMADDDPALLLAIAEIKLRGGQEDEAVSLAQRCISRAPELAAEVSALGMRATAASPVSAWAFVQLAVDHWTDNADLPTAAAALEEFVARVPDWTPALIRLVEIAIDADLPDVASRAQAQLADAYLKAGSASEALVVIEDLAVRERDNPAHVERLREALTALGEADVEAAIARRLNANLSFGDEVAGL